MHTVLPSLSQHECKHVKLGWFGLLGTLAITVLTMGSFPGYQFYALRCTHFELFREFVDIRYPSALSSGQTLTPDQTITLWESIV